MYINHTALDRCSDLKKYFHQKYGTKISVVAQITAIYVHMPKKNNRYIGFRANLQILLPNSGQNRQKQ
jgi:hypothetical protein